MVALPSPTDTDSVSNLSLLSSFPDGFRALILGASGAIGTALVLQLQTTPHCAEVIGLSRSTLPGLDFDNESSVQAAADALADKGLFHLIVNATGLLHSAQFMPEKKLSQLSYEQMSATFRINAFGPALVLAKFAPLLDRQRGVMAVMSAKVGSIEDNKLGGWYSYRASKAALNMLLRSAAIEVRRSNPQAVLVALHPGTVNSRLSAPFQGARIGRNAADAAADLLRVLDSLGPDDTGRFYSYLGEQLPW